MRSIYRKSYIELYCVQFAIALEDPLTYTYVHAYIGYVRTSIIHHNTCCFVSVLIVKCDYPKINNKSINVLQTTWNSKSFIYFNIPRRQLKGRNFENACFLQYVPMDKIELDQITKM